MNSFVLDASTALAWCFKDEISEQADRVLARVASSERIVVTSFWWYEILNALLTAERRGRITAPVAEQFLEELRAMDISADAPPTEVVTGKTQSLARLHSLTAYDAAYLELAMRERFALATLDVDMRRAAEREKVQLL